MRNAIFVDFEERNTASVDVWVIFGSFSKKGRHDSTRRAEKKGKKKGIRNKSDFKTKL